jgi:hypothetical protein
MTAFSRHEGPVVRKTHRSSWMISGWFKTLDLRAQGGGTACMTLGCPDDFVAVRVGFANIASQPWRITRVVARASSSFNNHVTPAGDAPWVTFTSCNGGQDSGGIVLAPPGGPAEIEVHGLGGSRMDQSAGVCWTWTDWAPVRSLAPDQGTGLRVLMLRALVPSNQTITFANGQLRRFAGDPAVNLGYEVFLGGIKFNTDLVTDPNVDGPRMPKVWLDNHVAPGTLFPIVQFLTRRAGVAGISVGDSHAQGTSTTEQYRSYGFCATAALIQRHGSEIPFGMVNCAACGLTSEVFFARFETLISAVRPSYALLPGWTYNDAPRGVNADRHAADIFLARLIHAVELCRQAGTLPVILTPFPRNRDAMGPVQLEPWRQLRDILLSLREPETVVVDATAVLGRVQEGLFDGTYLPSMSSDEMHPNDDGHVAVSTLLVDIIERYL